MSEAHEENSLPTRAKKILYGKSAELDNMFIKILYIGTKQIYNLGM